MDAPLLPPELIEAKDHLQQAARLIAAAQSNYLEGRGLVNTDVANLGRAAFSILDATHALTGVGQTHRAIDGPDKNIAGAERARIARQAAAAVHS
jgi:hypothetical protein